MHNRLLIPDPNTYHTKQQGFSLLEVLITVVVTSFGLLGIAGLQISSIQSSTVATVNTQAMISINEIVGLMRANSEAAKNGKFNIDLDANDSLVAFSTSLLPSTTPPNLSEMGAYNWFRNMNESISGVKTGIHCTAAGLCAVKVELPIGIDSNASSNMAQIVSFQL